MLLTLTLILLANAAPVNVQPDFDLDGDVDQSDYGMLQARLGEDAMPVSRWDLNRDGRIDAGDVDVFAQWARVPKGE